MRKVFNGFCVSLVVCAAGSAHAADISSLNWLSGCWIQDDGVKRIDETWLPPAGGVMLGVGRTVKAGTVREYEFTRIDTVDGALTYIAKPSGQAEASFTAISQAASEIVFENKAHDFPQRIIYRSLGADRLQAAIEGPIDGTTKTIRFDYKRCEAK